MPGDDDYIEDFDFGVTIRTSEAAVKLPWGQYLALTDRVSGQARETLTRRTPGNLILLGHEDKAPILAAIDEWLGDPGADPRAGDGIRSLRVALVAELG